MLASKELTQAVNRYARKYGHYASTVRTVTVLLKAAIQEYKDAKAKAASAKTVV